ncbi:MAG: hypothetical protein ACSHXF_07060 [Aquaticitalea sp.]
MKTYRKNGARAFRMAKLKQNPKQLLNAQAQNHDFLGKEEVQHKRKVETPLTVTNKHSIAKSNAADEAEEVRKKQYHESMTNTITNCGVFNFHVGTYGAKYATNKILYQPANLLAMEADAKTRMKGVDDAEVTWKYAVAERREPFDGLDALCALIVAEAALGDISAVTLGQLRTLMRLLRGERKVAKDPTNPNPNYRSVSQQRYDDIVATFGKLVMMVAADANYDPATDAIKLPALETLLALLQTLNNAVLQAEAELEAARTARNEFFNTPVTGLCDVFIKAKDVVLINFGRKSEQYDKIKGLSFRKIKVR